MTVNVFLLPIVGGVAYAAMKPGQVREDNGRFRHAAVVLSVCRDIIGAFEQFVATYLVQFINL